MTQCVCVLTTQKDSQRRNTLRNRKNEVVRLSTRASCSLWLLQKKQGSNRKSVLVPEHTVCVQHRIVVTGPPHQAMVSASWFSERTFRRDERRSGWVSSLCWHLEKKLKPKIRPEKWKPVSENWFFFLQMISPRFLMFQSLFSLWKITCEFLSLCLLQQKD